MAADGRRAGSAPAARRSTTAAAAAGLRARCGLPAVLLAMLLAGLLCPTPAGGEAPALPTGLSPLLSNYYSNDEEEKWLRWFVSDARCKSIARLFSIGKSVQGRDIWGLEISDKPGVAEDEPYYKYVANMHGDEAFGRQMLLGFADHLCDSWLQRDAAAAAGAAAGTGDAAEAARAAQAVRIVKDMHLYLVPSMNPDGFERTVRENQNGADLNRDFPDQFDDGPLMPDAFQERQPETAALMRWALAYPSSASANFHEGALVASYPWDGTRDRGSHAQPTPDDATYRHLASTYATAHASMSRSTQFKGGITNGAEWYPLYGGMQDWMYLRAGCMEMTLELEDRKKPPAGEIAALFEANRPALLTLPLVSLLGGVRGHVRTAAGAPVTGARVILRRLESPAAAAAWAANATVGADGSADFDARSLLDPPPRAADSPMGFDGWEFAAWAGAAFGDYYRPAVPGTTYLAIAYAPGHKGRARIVTVPSAQANGAYSGVVAEFVLSPGGEKGAGAPGGAGAGAAGAGWAWRYMLMLLLAATAGAVLCALTVSAGSLGEVRTVVRALGAELSTAVVAAGTWAAALRARQKRAQEDANAAPTRSDASAV